jgi:hypothetical protein
MLADRGPAGVSSAVPLMLAARLADYFSQQSSLCFVKTSPLVIRALNNECCMHVLVASWCAHATVK